MFSTKLAVNFILISFFAIFVLFSILKKENSNSKIQEDQIEARSIVLIDSQGKIRVRLSADKDVSLVFYDSNGNPKVGLTEKSFEMNDDNNLGVMTPKGIGFNERKVKPFSYLNNQGLWLSSEEAQLHIVDGEITFIDPDDVNKQVQKLNLRINSYGIDFFKKGNCTMSHNSDGIEMLGKDIDSEYTAEKLIFSKEGEIIDKIPK